MKSDKKKRLYFYLFDWANSPFSTVIITFIFSSYFVNIVSSSSIEGTSQWGWMIALSGICIAFLGPLLGIIADYKKKLAKHFILFATCIICICSALLWFSKPNTNFIFFTLTVIFISNTLFELSQIFYNSQLNNYRKGLQIGHFSGKAWAMGYIGGVFCLLLILFLFVLPEQNALGLNKNNYEHIRICGPIVAIWYILFAFPFLKNYEIYNFKKKNIRIIDLKNSILKSIKNKNTVKFLFARMFYTDGLITLFAFGGIYASGSFGFNFNEIIFFGITLNITAALGAYIFGFCEDRYGAKKVILYSLFALISISIIILIIKSKLIFWLLGASLGLFIGSIQSSSRTALIKLSEQSDLNKMFGLYAVSGKITNFLGPSLVASFTSIFESQRAGMSSILIFLILGFLLLRKTKI